MYWSPERSHPVLVTWNFTRASKIRRKIWWGKWGLFGEGCCHTRTEASQQVSTKRVPLTTRKPSFQIQSLLLRIVKELPSPKLFTKPRMRKLSQNGNPSQHMVQCQGQERKWNRTAFVATHRIAFLGSLSEMQKLRPPRAGLLSQNLPFTPESN